MTVLSICNQEFIRLDVLLRCSQAGYVSSMPVN